MDLSKKENLALFFGFSPGDPLASTVNEIIEKNEVEFSEGYDVQLRGL